MYSPVQSPRIASEHLVNHVCVCVCVEGDGWGAGRGVGLGVCGGER